MYSEENARNKTKNQFCKTLWPICLFVCSTYYLSQSFTEFLLSSTLTQNVPERETRIGL